MILPGSYQSGFAPRDGRPLYPELWESCVFAAAPCLGPTGLTLRDWSPTKNHGTITSSTAALAWQPSQGRYSVSNDGADDYIQLSFAPCMTNDLWSYSGWFYFRTLAGSVSDPCLLNSGGTYLAVGASNQLQFFSGGAWRSFSGGSVTTGVWVHLAWIRRTISSCNAYINGINIGLLAFNPGDLVSSTQLLSRVDAPSLGLDGLADGLMIHRRPLVENKITTLASRRGIANEMAPRRRSSVQVVTGNRRRRLLIGASS